jgi:hypothetical protein
MRLYLKDKGTEITGVHFDTVRKVLKTGGSLECYIRDTGLDNIAANFSNTLERVEVRKDDGSTVIWEGAINRCTQHSQPMWHFRMKGREILHFLDRTPCNFNSIKASGVVTSLSGAQIDDSEASFTSAVNGKPTFFSGASGGETSEMVFPHANSTWFNDPAADDPAEVETKQGNGDETDISAGGDTRYWIIYDTSNRGKDYYGIDLHFEVANNATSAWVEIKFVCRFEFKSLYVSEANSPVIQIYDVTNTSWEDDDTLNAGNIVGLGRTAHYQTAWDAHAPIYRGVITITDNTSRYFDGSDFLKIRILCGDASGAGHTKDQVRVDSAILTNVYSGEFRIAYETTYIVDAYDTDTLLFTGQTPDADGVDIGSSYSVGDYLHTNMTSIWSYSQINWVDLDFDTTTIGEANDYRGQFVGHVLSDYAERLDREVWQAIGWAIKCKSSYTDTALNLTENNFLDWSHSMTSDETFGSVTLHGGGSYNNISWRGGTYFTPEGKFYIDTRWAEAAMGGVVADNYESKYSTSKQIFIGTIDLDDGTDYSALDIGKTIDIILHSKITISAGLITELSYNQNAGENLQCNIVVRYDP